MNDVSSGSGVKIKYRADLLKITGKESESISAVSIKDVLEYLKKRYGLTAQKLAKSMLIVVNGHSILLLKNFKTILKNGDEVSFLPICGGG